MNYISYITAGSSYFLLTGPDEIHGTVTNWSVVLNMLGQFFFLIVVFIAIIFMAVYSLKFASRFRNYAGGNNNLKVIESRSLGAQNHVHLVKAGNKYILVGTSKENVSFLTEVDGESITDVFMKQSENTPKFQEQLTKQMKRLFNRQIPPEE